MKWILILLLLSGCATRVTKNVDVAPVETKIEVATPVMPLSSKVWRTPNFTSAWTFNATFVEAIQLMQKWANTDEFVAYVASKRTYFSHTDKSVTEALKLYREQLDRGDTIEITFFSPKWYNYLKYKDTIGGWDGDSINENLSFSGYGPNRRAAHLLHEVTHKYDWKHQGNHSDKYDNENSFPYAIGYDFEEFLDTKTQQVAGAP